MRAGGDAKLRKTRAEEDPDNPRAPEYVGGHKLFPVYGEMLRQVMLDYKALPDPRTLSMTEIRYLYDGIRKSLQERLVHRAKLKALERKNSSG